MALDTQQPTPPFTAFHRLFHRLSPWCCCCALTGRLAVGRFAEVVDKQLNKQQGRVVNMFGDVFIVLSCSLSAIMVLQVPPSCPHALMPSCPHAIMPSCGPMEPHAMVVLRY